LLTLREELKEGEAISSELVGKSASELFSRRGSTQYDPSTIATSGVLKFEKGSLHYAVLQTKIIAEKEAIVVNTDRKARQA
jgi:hypothetical protein